MFKVSVAFNNIDRVINYERLFVTSIFERHVYFV